MKNQKLKIQIDPIAQPMGMLQEFWQQCRWFFLESAPEFSLRWCEANGVIATEDNPKTGAKVGDLLNNTFLMFVGNSVSRVTLELV